MSRNGLPRIIKKLQTKS